MSITLKRIELWNIRCHEHFQFMPDEKGITSVSGANGAGKSTIVDAFAWALYGTKTNNTKNKMLIREGVSPKTTYVGVEVEIEINKIDYLIRRSIVGEGGGADCNIYGKSSESGAGEFNHLAGPAISSAEKYIKQILKMDEKGFLTAVLIQQKQVDQIVAASPRDRGEVIEKLTGIKSISNAIELAKGEARVAQKAASVITTQDTKTLREDIEAKIVEGKQLREVFDEDEIEITQLKTSVSDKSTFLEEYTSKVVEVNELKSKIDLSKTKIKMLSTEMDSYIDLVGDYKKENKSTIAEDIAPIEAEVNKISRELLIIENEQSKLTKRNDEIKTFLLSIENKVSKDVNKLKTQLGKLEENTTDIKASIEIKNKEIQNLKGEEKQVKKYLDTLGQDIDECPVCKSKLHNPDELKQEITDEIETLKQKGKDNKKYIKEKTDELLVIEREIEDLNVLINLHQEVELLTSEQSSIKAKLKEKTDEVTNKRAAFKVVGDHYRKALKVASRVDELNRAKKRIKEINEQVSKMKTAISSDEITLENLREYTNAKGRELTKELEQEKKTLNKLEVKHATDGGLLDSLRLQVASLKEKYASAESANKKYEQITKTMANANVASSLMAQFKENRIKVSIPALEMYASTILSKFTEGKFVKLELDSKFNTFVTTDTGKRRPIAQLSGGELSATAIALRIGISMLLNDGDNNVLILDEILVSMDEARARYIIETITSITNCQVIFIAHNTDIQNIADKTVSITA